jgi:hypothetical protein
LKKLNQNEIFASKLEQRLSSVLKKINNIDNDFWIRNPPPFIPDNDSPIYMDNNGFIKHKKRYIKHEMKKFPLVRTVTNSKSCNFCYGHGFWPESHIPVISAERTWVVSDPCISCGSDNYDSHSGSSDSSMTINSDFYNAMKKFRERIKCVE